MLNALKKWLLGVVNYAPCYDVSLLMDTAYAEGAKRERQEILDILDRLNVQYAEVYSSVARQAREEIAARGL